MTDKLIIPGELPTLNEIINTAKTHWGSYREMERVETKKIGWLAKKLPCYSRVHLKITYYRKDKKYDPDNIAAAKKFILDSLVDVGVLENDGWKQIEGWEETWVVDRDNPRTEIILEELG
jgi:hypothetical protein